MTFSPLSKTRNWFIALIILLAQRIFPGPYTLVVPASRDVPRTLTDAKRRTVGIRITSQFALRFCDLRGKRIDFTVQRLDLHA